MVRCLIIASSAWSSIALIMISIDNLRAAPGSGTLALLTESCPKK